MPFSAPEKYTAETSGYIARGEVIGFQSGELRSGEGRQFVEICAFRRTLAIHVLILLYVTSAAIWGLLLFAGGGHIQVLIDYEQFLYQW